MGTKIANCVNQLIKNGYTLIAYDDEIHARLFKYVDGNKFLVLVIGPHDSNNNNYIIRGEFESVFDRWSIASYERRFSSEEDFLNNWRKFWMPDYDELNDFSA